MDLINQPEICGKDILRFIFEYTKNYHCQNCRSSDMTIHYNAFAGRHEFYCAKCGYPIACTKHDKEEVK